MAVFKQGTNNLRDTDRKSDRKSDATDRWTNTLSLCRMELQELAYCTLSPHSHPRLVCERRKRSSVRGDLQIESSPLESNIPTRL